MSKPRRILICGDREWKDPDLITVKLQTLPPDTLIIEGECRGADKLARICAKPLGLGVLPFPADWGEYGKAAGPIRNQQMLDEGMPTEVWAFHDNFEESKGTRDMIKRATAYFMSRGAGLNAITLFSHAFPEGEHPWIT